jgi:hypothetical protein
MRTANLIAHFRDRQRQNPAADTSGWEREIDEAVYALYGLTPAEIKIVEESASRASGSAL